MPSLLSSDMAHCHPVLWGLNACIQVESHQGVGTDLIIKGGGGGGGAQPARLVAGTEMPRSTASGGS